MTDYYPMSIWLQRVDDFGVEVGEPVQSANMNLIHLELGERVKAPRFESDDNVDAHLDGEWTLREREFQEHKFDGHAVPCNLTLYIFQQ